MVVLPILSSLAMIFIMIIPGIFFRKRNILTVEQNGAVNSIVVNLTWPCLVIDAMQIEFSVQTLRDTGYILIACLAIFAVLLLFSIPVIRLMRLTKTKQYLTMFMLLFGNTGFIGIPVIKALYGTEALFFAAIVEFINDILLFTVGVLLVVPCIALMMIRLWAREFTLLEKVLVLSFAMPVASVSAIFSQQYKGEAAFATKSVLLSTVLSLATIPVFAILLEL